MTIYLQTTGAGGTGKGFNAIYRMAQKLGTETPTTTQISPTPTSSTTSIPAFASCDRQPVLFTAQNGRFSSPGYPNGYGTNQNCIWQIQTAKEYPGYKIELNFTDFDLGCPDDNLLVYYDTKQISLCDTPTYSIMAELGSVAINLRTDVNTAKSRGFTANYRMFSPLGSSTTTSTSSTTSPTTSLLTRQPSPATSSTSPTTNKPLTGCGGVFTEQSGIISSPSYPGNYPPEVTCVWMIDATSGRYRNYRIELKFLDVDVDCGDDLSVYIMNTMESLCGTSVPPEKVSESGKLHVIFKTDGSTSGRGFQAKYNLVPVVVTKSTPTTPHLTTITTGNTPTNPVTGPTTTPFVKTCGKRFVYVPEARIVSPVDASGQYEPYVTCVWSIEAPPGEQIQLTFETLDLQEDPNCRKDAIFIDDPDHPPAKVFASFIQFVCPTTIHR
ncbi:hypothetical protein LSH36_480g02065 [Paralvinella palmiformis]|uniref:CUB domain-containing protein n=1 Tax=Paralvinella palmiformis TaxID=53620 RepID=A0AAD9MWY5_9ANNE|nr:hypothetical protein LSH36_480g02065 [Paralvinella palmiformis]